MNAALRLSRAILCFQADETTHTLLGIIQPDGLVTNPFVVDKFDRSIFWHRNGILGISNTGISLFVKRMVGDLVFSHVIKDIFQCPIGDGITLRQPSSNGSIFKEINPRPLKSLPASPSIDHAVRAQGLESALKGLDLADAVVLVNVFLPQVGPVALVEGCLVANGNAFGGEYFGLEIVLVFEL
jgi:hypothetical protein